MDNIFLRVLKFRFVKKADKTEASYTTLYQKTHRNQQLPEMNCSQQSRWGKLVRSICSPSKARHPASHAAGGNDRSRALAFQMDCPFAFLTPGAVDPLPRRAITKEPNATFRIIQHARECGSRPRLPRSSNIIRMPSHIPVPPFLPCNVLHLDLFNV